MNAVLWSSGFGARHSGRRQRGRARFGRVMALVVGTVFSAIGPVGAQEAGPVRVYVDDFRNRAGNPALDALGSVLTQDIRLTLVLLDGFELVEDRRRATTEITGSVERLENGGYMSSASVREIERDEVVATERVSFESVFGVFDIGRDIGRRIMAAYTDQALFYGRLRIDVSRDDPALELRLAGQTLDESSLNLDQALAGSYPLTASFSGFRPFFETDIVIEDGRESSVDIDVPALPPAEYGEAVSTYRRELLSGERTLSGTNGDAETARGSVAAYDELLLPNAASGFSLVDAGDAPLTAASGFIADQGRVFDAVRDREQIPLVREDAIVVDGSADDWESVPIHLEDARGDMRADIQTLSLATDGERLYGLLGIDGFVAGDGFEVSIYVGLNALSNITAAVTANESAYLAVYKNPDRSRSELWSTVYETRTQMVVSDEFVEFSVPISAISFPGLEEGVMDRSGVPSQFVFDVEGVRYDSGTGDWDYSEPRDRVRGISSPISMP